MLTIKKNPKIKQINNSIKHTKNNYNNVLNKHTKNLDSTKRNFIKINNINSIKLKNNLFNSITKKLYKKISVLMRL